MNLRGYEGQLASYQEGLKFCHQDTHPEGWGYLHFAIGNAHYFKGRRDANPRKYYRQAVAEYNEALKTLTEADFPELHLEVLQSLIRALLGLQQTAEAKELKRRGTDLLRRLLNIPPKVGDSSLIPPKVGGLGGPKLALKFAHFQQLTVDIAVQSGQLVEALETAEEGKNACLTWLLYAWNDEIPSAKYAEIQQLLNPRTAAVYWHISPYALTTFIIKYGEATPMVLGIKNLTPQPPSLQGKGEEEELPPQPPSLAGKGEEEELPPSPRRRGDGGEVSLDANFEVTDSLNRLVKFEEWVKDWHQQYEGYRKEKPPLAPPSTGGDKSANSESDSPSGPLPAGGEGWGGVSWRDNLPKMLSRLNQILDIPAIESAITGTPQLILIPHRDLHRFPLHALFSNNFTITYLPSAQIGLTLLKNSSISTQQEASNTLLSIENPESRGLHPLLFAEIESSVVTQMFANPTRIAGANATLAQLETELKKPHNIFHFTGHASYNFRNPSQSALALSGDDKLTLAEIVQKSFSGYQLISLSGCETAITGNETITTEYVGLVSGFLRQGASYVLSTLWTVDEISSALIVIRFYQFFKAGATPTAALKLAQNWLRTVTYSQLAKWYAKLATDAMRDADYGCWQRLGSLARNSDKMDSSQPPYQHPYFWAGFTLAGKVNP